MSLGFSATIPLKTKGFCDMHDLTAAVAQELDQSGLSSGLITVFVPGSTGSVTTIEFEDGALDDLKRAIEKIAPQDGIYAHNERWGDGNGFSHVRAALLGPSITIPFQKGRMLLGTWQQILFIDFDNRPRKREIIIQAVGK